MALVEKVPATILSCEHPWPQQSSEAWISTNTGGTLMAKASERSPETTKHDRRIDSTKNISIHAAIDKYIYSLHSFQEAKTTFSALCHVSHPRRRSAIAVGRLKLLVHLSNVQPGGGLPGVDRSAKAAHV